MPKGVTGERSDNLADSVRRAAGDPAHRDRTAVRWCDDEQHWVGLSWAELDAAVETTARAFAALEPDREPGTRPARVALVTSNGPAFVTCYFGALRAGLTVVPVNPGLTARELGYVLADCGASVVIATPAADRTVAEVAGSLPALRHRYLDTGRPLPAGLPKGTAVPRRVTGGEDLAVLLYTSGTEGDPKGAMLSHRALLANQEQLAALRPATVGPDDVVLLALPLFHAYGVNTGLGAVAFHAACGVLVDRFDPARSAEAVASNRVTMVIGVPSMYVAWANLPDRLPFGSVRTAVSGAAPLDPAVGSRFTRLTGLHVQEGYGLTETAPVLTTTLGIPPGPGAGPETYKPGSIGRPLPGVELKLVAADGEEVWHSGAGVPAEEFDITPGSPGSDPGEIVVRGANLFSGYWPDGRGGPDAQGWWATGDVAYADEDGDLFIVDRIGELILVNGFNVYPHEVERILTSHPAVRAAAVIGVPDPSTGQAVKACVVAERPVSMGELFAFCERNLARFKCPTSIEFVSRLPYSALGKVRKRALRGNDDGVSADAEAGGAPH